MTSAELGDAVIIEAAINGATPKSRNAMVPRTPGEVAEDGLSCLEAGAAIVHNHNDEPVVGDAPEHDPAPYIEAWTAILAERPDALLYPTMPSGGPHTTFERRYAHIPALADAGVLRIGLVDPGLGERRRPRSRWSSGGHRGDLPEHLPRRAQDVRHVR